MADRLIEQRSCALEERRLQYLRPVDAGDVALALRDIMAKINEEAVGEQDIVVLTGSVKIGGRCAHVGKAQRGGHHHDDPEQHCMAPTDRRPARQHRHAGALDRRTDVSLRPRAEHLRQRLDEHLCA